jgi:hypothetical protein
LFHFLLVECWRSVFAVRNQEIHRAGTRYAIDGDGLTTEEHGAVSFLPWRRIDRVWTTKTMLFALFDHKVLCIPTPTFGDQDAAGFCAELKWRWERREQLQKPMEANAALTPEPEAAET